MPRHTVHLVCNAHIDPVWLWPWSGGLDEIVSTCESVCGLLERNRDVIFTRGEAWVYEHVERIAPQVFARIRRLVRRGQWEIVGGWYLQPDCNLPGERSLQRQIELGRDYFQRRFGVWPDIGYNVDSFGHHARLPALLHAAGQRHYVMMRPEQHETALSASLFWWRGETDGPRVLTFRIEGAYCTTQPLDEAHIRKSLRSLAPGVTHTMCFIGLGDHGGGPSQEMVDWCRAHRDAFEGIELEFSSPARFFAAVRRQARNAPTVTGELQPHAVGCYSVQRVVKAKARRAENLLTLAEGALQNDPGLRRESAVELDRAWRWLCFNQFHDTLGGTAVASAHEQIEAQLGYSIAVGDEVSVLAARRRFARLPPDAAQRLAIVHHGPARFDDWIEHEPWLEWTQWQADWALADERGELVPHQCLRAEGTHGHLPRLLFRLAIEPGQMRVLRIVRGTAPARPPRRTLPASALVAARGNELAIRQGRAHWTLPTLELVEDKTDTWSHGIESFDGPVIDRAQWRAPERIDAGPLLSSWMLRGRIGASALEAEWRVYRDTPGFELRLTVAWSDEHKLLRLLWPQHARIDHRIDGMPGHAIRRSADGRERPLQDWSCANAQQRPLGAVVSPDVYSISAVPEALRFTLLRAPLLAHHDPDPGDHPRRVFSDRGTHRFTFRFFPAVPAAGALRATALALQQRPLVGDVTRGMPLRALRGRFMPVAR